MKRSHIIATLVAVGHNERKLSSKSNDSLRKLLNLGNKKIQALREEKAKKEAELAARMKERAERQREEAKAESLRVSRQLLRSAREAKEMEPIKRFQKQGFKPLPRIGVRVTTEDPIRQRLAELDAKVDKAKAALRNNRVTKDLSKAAALAVLERNCFVDELPESQRRRVVVEDYVRRTDRPLFGVKS
jgi:hypothetical protein